MEEMERPEMRKLQKEQERERRRLRDRQRRQSMSVEEREKHLARRRRNYQLRRLRAENARLDLDPQSQSQPTTPPTDQIPPLNSVSDLSLQCTDVGSHQECTKSESLEVPAHILAKFSGQLRLNRIKHLARSLNGPVGDNHKISVDMTVKGLEASNGKFNKILTFTNDYSYHYLTCLRLLFRYITERVEIKSCETSCTVTKFCCEREYRSKPTKPN
ncbi:hypothetical protein Dsin_012798 [Dipteronia sinensis]|uniref:Uncharacterized protein n=1 Tax=Dipteronia sinensis TaxID=43782 RepID=A0AAE0E8A0_9ROSI|nr:hypothetical protein Dsin_012798 [Dipteronia sinensis]